MVVLRENLREYLSEVFGEKVEVYSVGKLGNTGVEERDLKGFGYGVPYIIELKTGGVEKKVVLETMRASESFGHNYSSDRAGILLWQHSAFNKLPKHVHSVDVGAFTKEHGMKSLGGCEEFFIVTNFVEGSLYHEDLDRLKMRRQLNPLDLERCKALSKYLVEIHKTKNEKTERYIRRLRDLVGHGECIMGILDSYPTDIDIFDIKDLLKIEKMCVEWRWKLKQYTHRLAQVHGDYHPWNILFHDGADFTVLDRSRGEWGEPADDLSAMTINYLFYSLQANQQIIEPFSTLFNLFWKTYLDGTGDQEMLRVIQPFFAWRSLVLASPTWYPNLSKEVRTSLISFTHNVLKTQELDYTNIDSYFKP